MVGIAGVCAASGCRTATRIIQEPRVDLELAGGNRGYLVGNPPSVSESRKTTRQMVETEIEVPGFRRGGAAPVTLGDVAPPEMDFGEEAAMPEEGVWQRYDTYVVKQGETLWSIASQPEVFGDARKWRRLYDANRDVLKSPDRLRPGMTLRIPRGEPTSQDASEEAATFVK